MFERSSLRWPITLGVIMIVSLVALIVGWVLLAVFGAAADSPNAALYWTLLSVGTVFLVFVLVGVVMYLTLSVKSINLNRRQSNFIDSVTHELKSPIASLKLYLQTLNRRQLSEDERESFHRIMLEDVERLDHLINHLLDAGRVDKRRGVSELEDVELSALLEECARTVCARNGVPSATVNFGVQKGIVHARRVDLEIIFRNLIDNAVKYAGQPPRVDVELFSATDDQVAVQIRDNGKGIPAAMRRKIFGRFVRLGVELQREKPGTGLGLYIVRTLVRRLGGRITLHDGTEGSGTTFEVHLPGWLLAAQAGDIKRVSGSTVREAGAA